MATPFIGEIKVTSFNFAPRGWALCDGRLLPIAQYQALFSILGTTYGGDGRTTFALPDLRGRLPLHVGNGITEGTAAGEEAHTLTNAELPSHNHTANAVSTTGESTGPAGGLWAVSGQNAQMYATSGADTTMSPAATANAGGSQPHGNLQPYLVVNFIIALEGIYPSRD